MKSVVKPPKNSTSRDTQQMSSDAETVVGTAVENSRQAWVPVALQPGMSRATTALVLLSPPASPGR